MCFIRYTGIILVVLRNSAQKNLLFIVGLHQFLVLGHHRTDESII